MIITIIIAFISLIGLVVLHELGHFILAKKFGVRVDEFGIGYPPRLFGKKIGETIYSLNLLPFGAFVRIYGEEDEGQGQDSFNQKKLWQRALIIGGGVISFWLISIVLLTIVMFMGAPSVISDQELGSFREDKVQIAAIAANSPAAEVGLKVGDIITGAKNLSGQEVNFDKVEQIQNFTKNNEGRKIFLIIKRGSEVFDVFLIPRVSPPEGEGAMGVALVRTALKSYPWWQAPAKGVTGTFNLTLMVINGWAQAIKNITQGQPSGVQVMGPVGIFSFMSQVGELGASYFLQFIALISVYIALFNALPIPSFDGGKLLFLAIEAVRKKPVPVKIEQNITLTFFGILILLMVWVTIKDVSRLF